MADPVFNYGNTDRDIEQALIALKKGTQLLKYSRKGKPKFCPFRVSTDETTLIWYSHGSERTLKLSSITRIIPGQRTAVFRRYSRPEKDYLSFSLLYNNGERSLDLICKDKAEVEVWLAGLTALISTGKNRNRRSRSDFLDLQDSDIIQSGRPFSATLEFTSSIARGRVSIDSNSRDSCVSSHVVSERANMQLRGSTGDGFRISVSSTTPSCSSGGSGQDDIESLGDVYVWGEIWSDGGGISDGPANSIPKKVDVLTPKPLESDVVLDVHQIACGGRHIALVTKQGELFTWGEESGGRLGHGISKDFSRPHLVDFLALNTVDYVACGEYHTCAVCTSGDVYTWGDGTQNAGLLGHGTNVSHWFPKRLSNNYEGLQVLSIACGSWHTAFTTSNGKLFTFGDGTFGVLGHGDRENVYFPKEVQSLSGLRTIKVACGLWHTAAIVEVMGQSGTNISSRKLFTWGDGDKHRLGHGSKDAYLLPTCVSLLIDYNFHQLACGNTITVALTTSGHVFTMGSSSYGQLGNPTSDGKLPCQVQDKLVGEFVEEIACGAFHVAVLTSRSEVYTWGRGANGRLGHGDVDDRKVPTMVEALRDRHVKNISCGSNFTASICIHKWVSGLDQSVCSSCRQAFGFTRKRHNCYNCGLVHCHACSSKKALRAALAPTPGKPHRVCDSCYAKLKAAEAGTSTSMFRRVTVQRRSVDTRERTDRGEIKSSRVLIAPTTEPVKYVEVKTGQPGSKNGSLSIVRASQVPSHQQLKDIAFPSSLSSLQNAMKPVVTTPTHSTSSSRSSSPYSSRRLSPLRIGTPVFSRSLIDSLNKTNEFLNQEITKLQNQIKGLKQRCDVQDGEIKKLQKDAQEATSTAANEASRFTTARGIFKTIASQLKELREKLAPELSDNDTFNNMQSQVEAFLSTNAVTEWSAPSANRNSSLDHSNAASESNTRSKSIEDQSGVSGSNNSSQDTKSAVLNASNTTTVQEIAPPQNSGNGSSSISTPRAKHDGVTQVIEQFEPGVYITLDLYPSGIKIFKRVKFSKRRFAEQQAEEWWNKNKDRVLKKYPPVFAANAIPPAPPSTPPPPPPSLNNDAASSSGS